MRIGRDRCLVRSRLCSCAAFRECISVFTRKVSELSNAADAASTPEEGTKAWKDGLRAFSRETFWYYGALQSAVTIIRDFVEYKPVASAAAAGVSLTVPLETLTGLLDGVELWQIGRDFEEGVRSLARWAIYTVGELAAAPGATRAGAIATTVAQFIHDAEIRGYKLVHNVFSNVVLTPLHREVTPTIKVRHLA